MRVKRGSTLRKRHKKVLKAAKGFLNRRGTIFRAANQAVMKAGRHAYRHRRQKKSEFRGLWIVRINAACREHGISYSQFINGLNKANIKLNRKMLSHLAVVDKDAFNLVIEKVKVAA